MNKIFIAAMSVLVLSAGLPAAAEEASWLEIGGDYQFRYDILKATVHDYMQYTGSPANGFTTYPNPMGGTMNINTVGVKGYESKNDSLMTNRFGVHLKATATENVAVKAKLDMYKIWGSSDSSAVTSPFYSPEKSGVFDGNSTHVPEDNVMRLGWKKAFNRGSSIEPEGEYG
jgi:hypothetical protein